MSVNMSVVDVNTNSNAPSWLVTYFCPAVGVLLSTLLGMAPIRAVLQARKEKKLGYLSPLPFALLTNSSLGWVMYAVYLRDYFIFFSNGPCFCISFALCLTAIHILEKTEDGHGRENQIRIEVEQILLCSCCLWIVEVLITGITFGAPEYDSITTLVVGIFSVLSTLLFCAAPLMNMVQIVKTKDSSSLYAPALILIGVKSMLWFFYGLLGINNIIVWFPNCVNLLLVAVELLICFIYPAKSYQKNRNNDKDSIKLNELNELNGFTYNESLLSDYAVYTSSRHLSTADIIFPITYIMSSEKTNNDAISGKNSSSNHSRSPRPRMATINEINTSHSSQSSLATSKNEEDSPGYNDEENNITWINTYSPNKISSSLNCSNFINKRNDRNDKYTDRNNDTNGNDRNVQKGSNENEKISSKKINIFSISVKEGDSPVTPTTPPTIPSILKNNTTAATTTTATIVPTTSTNTVISPLLAPLSIHSDDMNSEVDSKSKYA